MDGKAAVISVGCNPKTAKKTACVWRQRPDVARAVNLWIRERLAKTMPATTGTPEQQAEAVLKTAWLTASASVQWFTKISPDGSCLVPDFTHCTDEMMQAIEAIDVEEREGRGGEVVRRIRLKSKNSVRALELLARAMGMDRREVKVGLSGELNFGVQQVERIKRLLLGRDQLSDHTDHAMDDGGCEQMGNLTQ